MNNTTIYVLDDGETYTDKIWRVSVSEYELSEIEEGEKVYDVLGGFHEIYARDSKMASGDLRDGQTLIYVFSDGETYGPTIFEISVNDRELSRIEAGDKVYDVLGGFKEIYSRDVAE